MTMHPPAAVAPQSWRNTKWFASVAAALGLWAALYSQLAPFSQWAVRALSIDAHSRIGEAIAFFFYDAPKVLLLLTLVVFAMGIVRSFFSAERTRALLAGRARGSWQRPCCLSRHRHSLLLVLSRAAVYRLCQRGRSSRRDFLLPDRGANG
jgi:hypothetical protein